MDRREAAGGRVYGIAAGWRAGDGFKDALQLLSNRHM